MYFFFKQIQLSKLTDENEFISIYTEINHHSLNISDLVAH